MKLLPVAVGPRKLAFGVTVYIIVCYAAYSAYVSRRIGRHPPLASLLDSVVVAPAQATGKTVAIGCAVTSKRLRAVNESNIAEKFVLLSSLLPSFCRTASLRFRYAFYLAYDYTDRFFSSDRLSTLFAASFRRQISKFCPRDVAPTLHLVNCSYRGSPAWAQNDAMMDAYLDNVDYFYRINDDTKMETSEWTEAFVEALDRFDPPRVGVVGPHHVGGNRRILTYDFVHRTHVDAFGFYYPRAFTDWFGDGWITRVYTPDRCAKLRQVRVRHTLSLGTRYSVNRAAGRLLQPTVQRDKLVLDRYIAITIVFKLQTPLGAW